MKLRIVAITIAIVSTLMGCAAPQQVVEQASKILIGECKELFLSQKNGGYQHVAQIHANGKAVFAFAQENGLQKCGMARSGFDLPAQGKLFETPGSSSGWEQLEVIAISRCEQQSSSIKTSCKVFARNNEIVWGKRNENSYK
jgi:hypothetical protein